MRDQVALTIATLLWDANHNSLPSSRKYDETWVDKLQRSFARHLTIPHRFVCFVDRPRRFEENVLQERIRAVVPDYGTCIEPYRLGVPMILVGLDTVVVRNIDHLAQWCLEGDRPAFNRDVRDRSKPINGVGLIPAGWQKIFSQHRGENDMDWVSRFPWQPIDDKWPDQCVSYKMRVRANGNDLSPDNRIVYMHGTPKQDDLGHLPWVSENWR